EVIKESIIQTHEIAIELTWKTVKCFALRVEPSGQISGSTTAIKHGLSTGVIKEEKIARTLLEAIQHHNLSSHEYLLLDGIDDYVNRIRNEFQPAMIAFLSDLITRVPN
ncbi:MAG: nucleotidyltransferase substrate binding protein, partial [Bacteroidales bacterium]|nr:nucleotidyltransferase substrate binding protein [Bacteroidales bacterium]